VTPELLRKHLPDELPHVAAEVPSNTLDSLRRYAIYHIPTGGFLTAVLANDLMQAVARADICNRAALHAICQYVFNCLPRQCWGNYVAVEEWVKVRFVPEEK
jgi:hypothetical protein